METGDETEGTQITFSSFMSFSFSKFDFSHYAKTEHGPPAFMCSIVIRVHETELFFTAASCGRS